MTLYELSHHLRLQERLARDEQILISIQSAVGPGSQVLTGMPHTPGIKDKVGDLAAEIADLKAEIALLAAEAEAERRAIFPYIEAIPETHIRTIMRLRFVRCLSWREVAAVIGGRNTDEGVKTACYRYLREEKEKKKKSCTDMTRDVP